MSASLQSSTRLAQLGVGAEEVLAHVLAVARLERLVLAVDRLVHALDQATVLVVGQERIPARAPDHLDHVPARAAELGLELLDDLAVAAHRAVEALQVAVDDEDQVVELLAAGQADRAHRLGLVHLAVAHERPDLAPRRVGDLPALEVLEKPGLVDRHDRPEAHRDGGELPELRHQPRVRVGGDAGARDLLAEALHLLLGQPPFEEGARVDAGGGVALDVDQVAAVLVGGRVPEVVEADLVEQRGRLVGGDVAAELGGLRVGLQDRGDRVPADQRAQAALEVGIARQVLLLVGRDRVDVVGVAVDGDGHAVAVRVGDGAGQELVGAVGAVVLDHRLDGLEPLPRLLRVYVVFAHPPYSYTSSGIPVREPAMKSG